MPSSPLFAPAAASRRRRPPPAAGRRHQPATLRPRRRHRRDLLRSEHATGRRPSAAPSSPCSRLPWPPPPPEMPPPPSAGRRPPHRSPVAGRPKPHPPLLCPISKPAPLLPSSQAPAGPPFLPWLLILRTTASLRSRPLSTVPQPKPSTAAPLLPLREAAGRPSRPIAARSTMAVLLLSPWLPSFKPLPLSSAMATTELHLLPAASPTGPSSKLPAACHHPTPITHVAGPRSPRSSAACSPPVAQRRPPPMATAPPLLSPNTTMADHPCFHPAPLLPPSSMAAGHPQLSSSSFPNRVAQSPNPALQSIAFAWEKGI